MNSFCNGGFNGGGGGLFGGMNPMFLIIIFLLFTQGGCNGGGGLFGGDNCIFILLILFCCMGGNMGCGVCEGK